ncbi:MAG: DNA polymerase III subunit delta' [Candidatus Aminicenantes bacterium]|nr:DNA polymerase III subunit delta' [Candidatus Aminicenantes bacterium]
MSFSDIVGNEQIKKTLQLSLSKKRLPNSLLFAGPPGVGKFQMALTVAQALNCSEMADDACGRCDSCQRVSRNQHPNVKIVQREKNREQIVKEQVDEINYLSRMRPWQQGKLVFIINEAERMNETVANSLLKTLEEPSSYIYFILITEDLQMILPTIRSRCQVLRFQSISEEDITKALIARGVPEDRAALIAATCDGNLEKASEIQWEEFKAQRDRAWQLFLGGVEKSQAESLMSLVSGRSRKDFLDEYREILSFFSVFFRDILALHEKKDGLLLNPDLKVGLNNLAVRIGASKAVAGVKFMEDLLLSLKKNPNLAIINSELIIFLREISYG